MAHRWGYFLTGFIVSAAYWPGMLSAVFVPRWAAIAILVPLLFPFALKRLPDKIWGLLIFSFGVAAVSLALSPDHLTGIHALMLSAILVLPFLAGASLDCLDDVFHGLASGLGISSAVVVAQMMGWHGVPQVGNSPSGLFYNSEVLAEFSALVSVWGLARRKWWVCAMTLAPVAVCHSRIAVLTVFCALIYMASVKLPKKWTAVLVAAVIVAGLSALFIMGPGKLGTAFHRITIWWATTLSLTPLGNGMGWAHVAFPVEQFVHSDALQMLAEIGIPALGMLYIPWTVFKRKDDHVISPERAVFWAGCFQIAVSFPLHFPASGFVVALVAGHLLRTGPVVRLGHDQRGIENGDGVRRPGEAGPGIIGGRGGGSAAISV